MYGLLGSTCSEVTAEVLFMKTEVDLRRMDCTFRASQEESEETKSCCFIPFSF